MNAVRKIIGLFLIIFIGLPTLFGIVWAVGMMRATVSAEFLTELPRKIIADLPDKTDQIFRDGQKEEFISDKNTRAWFQAMAKTGISPRELMEKTGLLEWMRGELSGSIEQLGLTLRGERRPKPIVIDLQPLKAALLSPEMDRFIDEMLKNLPPCDEQGLEAWTEIAAQGRAHRELPACVPDPTVAKAVILNERAKAVNNIDNELELMSNVHDYPRFPFNLSQTVTFITYFLFLIPAVFIFLGALIGASSPAGVFRWSGISVIAGSVPALLLALTAKYFSSWLIKAGPHSWHGHWNSELAELVFDKMRWIPMRIVDQLFSPVVGVALIVGVAGIVLYALSFSVRDNVRKVPQPVSAPPAAPQK
jgi:hypothetical protein